MKKQVLLLIPAALLALTACDNSSSGGSIVNPTFASPEEIFAALADSSFTVDVKDDYYDQGDPEKDTIKCRYLKDHAKLEYQTFEENGRPGNEYTTAYYYELATEPVDIIEYYRYNTFWLTHKIESLNNILDYTYIEEAFSYMIAPEPEVAMEFHINEDSVEGTVYAESGTIHITMTLTESFFSELKIERVNTEKVNPFCWDTTFTVTKFGETVVNLPDTPAQDLFDQFMVTRDALIALDSYTLHANVKMTNQGQTNQLLDVTYKVMREDTFEVYEKLQGTQTTYYAHLQTATGEAYKVYDTSEEQPAWAVIDYDEFIDKVRMALIHKDFEDYEDAESLAVDLVSVEKLDETEMKFELARASGTTQAHQEVDFILNNNIPVSWRNIARYSMDGQEMVMDIEFAITDVNSTSFEYPTL